VREQFSIRSASLSQPHRASNVRNSSEAPVGELSCRIPAEPGSTEFATKLSTIVARFSVGWLVAANLVGVWMALLLVEPGLGAGLGEYSYGRWAPLHLDWHLYGWCSLPLVGALFTYFLRPSGHALRQARWALAAWSAALLVGGFGWLQGETTGKLFLDWTGVVRLSFVGAQIALWSLLAAHWFNGHPSIRLRSFVAPLLLLALAGVPVALYWASGQNAYPAIDPSTGGPTGASLLGSTLGIVLIFSLVPSLLSGRRRDSPGVRRHWICFGVSCGVFAALERSQGSHHDLRQIAGLGTLLIWIPLLAIHLRGFQWNAGSRRWLTATLCWWCLLVGTGFLEFCPGILDRTKFTHALVAHAHLAMAGLVTSFNMLLLTNLGPAAGPLAKRGPFALWHAGLVGHLVTLALLAGYEASDAGWLFQRSETEAGLYIARLCAGAIMAGASVWWLANVTRSSDRDILDPA